MIRRIALGLTLALGLGALGSAGKVAAQERAYGQVWGGAYGNRDWERFYHYPYVFYPQNFWGNEYYRSSQDMYYRYPPEMQIPVYNKKWQNYYPGDGHSPGGRRYHFGHHFMLDIF